MSPAEEFIRSLLERAVMENAADIHLEPWENSFRVRLRKPSGLITLPAPDKTIFAPLVRHLKLLARLDIAMEALPQDGKFAYAVGGSTVEFRLSCLPTLYGPSIVLRVLDRERTPLSLDALGFESEIVREIRRALGLPFGLIAVVGSTGSGKTTTLYACLRELAESRTRKILSVEDPIEYALSGVQQVAVSPSLDFSSALRSFLRHDPDVIFVGEIRDKLTARLAIQAALTGHLVLTSLHTHDAPQAITRLIDLGVEPYLLDSALKFVLSQTLETNDEGLRVPAGKIYWHGKTVAAAASAL